MALKKKKIKNTVTIPQVTKSNSIVFDDKLHKYYKGDIELISVTTWLDNEFFPKFDENNKHIHISNAISNKNKKKNIGITNPIDLRRYWYCKGRKASHTGSAAHELATMLFIANNYGEDTFNYTVETEVKTGYQKAVVNAWKDITKEWEIVDSERIVSSLKYNLAGTIDLVLKHRKTGRLALGDFKAKDDLHKSYNECRNELKKYKDSGYIKAIAQMTAYSIIAGYNVEPEDIFVIKLNADGTYHIKGGNNKLPDLRKEIGEALERQAVSNPNKKYIMDLI